MNQDAVKLSEGAIKQGNASSFSEGMAGVAIGNQGGYIDRVKQILQLLNLGAMR